MSLKKEVEIQELVIDYLSNLDISPFSVIFTYSLNDGGTLSITFWINSDIDDFLNHIDYKSICDKTGYIILRENNTILITGFALIDFYSKVKFNL